MTSPKQNITSRQEKMSTGGGSPCGACKFLKRKCVAECVFAPYFGSEEGTVHFAAVHKVFGASNTSKLLMAIPESRRIDAAVTLCYEALARVRDPVYGCVGRILALQDQVMNLQAELAYVRTHLSTLPPPIPPQNNSPTEPASSSNAQLIASADDNKNVSSNSLLHIHCMSQQQQQLDESKDTEISTESVDFTRLSKLLGQVDPVNEEADLDAFAREFVSKYLSQGKC